MQLTKEQIEQMEKCWLGTNQCYDELREVFRGYRAYLAEIAEHENSIELLKQIGADGGPAEYYHRARLSALKKGAV